MKILNTVTLFDHLAKNGSHPAWFKKVDREIASAVKAIKWPAMNAKFILNPTKKVTVSNRSKKLSKRHWQAKDGLLSTASKYWKVSNTGPIDVVKKLRAGLVAVEWETGNISSSHRALNKLALGIANNHLVGGVLVNSPPSRAPRPHPHWHV